MTTLDSIPPDTSYVPIVQQKWCCVPACISMIMLRHNLTLLPQEELGYHLGLIVPEEDVKYFCKVRTGPRPSAGYGTQIQKFNINDAFKDLQIPLRMKYMPISETSDPLEYLSERIQADCDIAVCFNHYHLYGNGNRGGHVCLVDKLDRKAKSVRLIDPGFNVPKWRVVALGSLIGAI